MATKNRIRYKFDIADVYCLFMFLILSLHASKFMTQGQHWRRPILE